MEYFTLLISSERNPDIIETFKAGGMEDAIGIVKKNYPDKTYRLYRGKSIPEKEVKNLKTPPRWQNNKKT